MPTRANKKRQVRVFATLNHLSYTTALRVLEGARPLEVSSPVLLRGQVGGTVVPAGGHVWDEPTYREMWNCHWLSASLPPQGWFFEEKFGLGGTLWAFFRSELAARYGESPEAEEVPDPRTLTDDEMLSFLFSTETYLPVYADDEFDWQDSVLEVFEDAEPLFERQCGHGFEVSVVIPDELVSAQPALLHQYLVEQAPRLEDIQQLTGVDAHSLPVLVPLSEERTYIGPTRWA